MLRLLSAFPSSPARVPTVTAFRRASPTPLGSVRRTTVDWDAPASSPAGSVPANDDDTGPFPRLRVDLEFVHQPPCAAQSEPKSAAGGVAVRQGQLEIRDTRPLVLEGDAKP